MIPLQRWSGDGAAMARTYYEILGVPVGASINHIKDSYRLLTKKTVITDAAYETHTHPATRREYNAQLAGEFEAVVRKRTGGPAEGGLLVDSDRHHQLFGRIDSDSATACRITALASLREHGFRDCTAEVEQAPSWKPFLEANGSGTERYFFSQNSRYLVMIDFSPFVPSGEGWHTLGWWLYLCRPAKDGTRWAGGSTLTIARSGSRSETGS